MVRTRIAPSPTGDPHVGTAYVALFNYAWAKKNGGQFILRIEDTDRERSSRASEQMIFDSLHWLGLSWDEGPDVGGPHAPYRQSERTAIYQQYAEELMERGGAYPCFCTKERLDALREQQRQAKAPVMGYDRHCRALPKGEAKARRRAGEPHVVRLAMPTEGVTRVRDFLRGELEFDNTLIDDQVLLKSDGYPTYHLANVVDDHLMGVTHVIRAEEWISSLPKHAQLYRAFGWEEPVFCHLPLLRNADRSKISKRKNPTSLNFYRRAGYLPEAMLNYLALMGWTMPDGREEFSLDEFVEAFTLERIVLGGPVFDLAKLTWLNGKYIRALTPEALLARLKAETLAEGYLLKVLPLVRERIDKLEDFIAYASFFFVGEVAYEAEVIPKLIMKQPSAVEAAGILEDLLEEVVDPLLEWNQENLEAGLRRFAESRGLRTGDLFMAVRVAVTGRTATPPLFETMEVLGKETCRRRLRAAVRLLRGQPLP
ncbi:MAG: glutamate--tRNA ligase [Thermoanaerobaculum sp.]|nr:glutamate--tRNA ligase [Thermoanaerobaculum sp.]MDW7967702.1 glutamate--tRNA ligase [Thermoanaerobaculum sp.]